MTELIEYAESSTPQSEHSNLQNILRAIVSEDGEKLLSEFANTDGASLVTSLISQTGLGDQEKAFISALLDLGDDDREDKAILDGATVSYELGDDDNEADEHQGDYLAVEGEYLSDLQQEVEELRMANDNFAAAVGACPYCWGGDDECAECGGEGLPGSLPPDKALFNDLVAPAVAKIHGLRRSERLRSGHKRR